MSPSPGSCSRSPVGACGFGVMLAAASLVVLLGLGLALTGNALLVSLERGLPLRPPPDAPPGAIVILSAEVDRTPDGLEPGKLTLQRLLAGARLWQRTHCRCWSRAVRSSRARCRVAQVMAQTLERDFHVPVRWIEDRSETTWENAADSAAILRPSDIRSVYVVTHAWHERRAVLALPPFRAVADRFSGTARRRRRRTRARPSRAGRAATTRCTNGPGSPSMRFVPGAKGRYRGHRTARRRRRTSRSRRNPRAAFARFAAPMRARDARIGQQCVQRSRECLIILRPDERGILGREHQAHVAHLRRRHRQPRRHRLDHRQRHLLGVRRQREDVEPGVKRGRLGDMAGERDSVRHAEFGRQLRSSFARSGPSPTIASRVGWARKAKARNSRSSAFSGRSPVTAPITGPSPGKRAATDGSGVAAKRERSMPFGM